MLGRPSQQDVTHKGVTLKSGVQLWPVGVDTAKSRIYGRLKITAAGPGCLHFPLGLPDEYYEGLIAERLVTKYQRGYPVRVFELDSGARNEPLDTAVYAYAAALYAGMQRVNWDKLEAPLKAPAGDLFVQAANAAGPEPRAPGPARDAAASSQVAQAAAGDAAGGVPPAPPAAEAVTEVAAARRVRIRRPNWVTGYRR